jgi:hypothetical protein
VDHLSRAERGVDRRAPEPLLYTGEQLAGRAPIRLRRHRDKTRLAYHLILALVLTMLTVWWVVPSHTFAGPVVLNLAGPRGDHGVHLGDLPSLAFVLVALRSAVQACRLVLDGRLFVDATRPG